MTFVKKPMSVALLGSVACFGACGTGSDGNVASSDVVAGPSNAGLTGPSGALPTGARIPSSALQRHGLSGLLTASGSAAGQAAPTPMPNEVVVQLRAPSTSATSYDGKKLLKGKLSAAARAIRAARRPASTARRARSELFTVEVEPASGRSVADVIQDLKQMPEVEFAEPNYRYEAFAVPDDPFFTAQGHLTPIRATQAWDTTTGSNSVVVAVIDSGVDVAHADLASNIWRNPGEVEGDGLDNDQNGLIDDVTGYDFVTATVDVAPGEDPGPPDNNPSDFNGHGTHVAGIIGAVGNNGNGVTGVAWTVKLMPLRAGYQNTAGQGVLLLSDIASALRYAADEGAHIVNMSFGGPQPSQILADGLRYAADRGVLLVAAAGNAGTSVQQYPGANDRVLSVAATDNTGAVAAFSSFGPWVDIAAPGVDVLSTWPGDNNVFLSGTSMASPVVAGTAALVRGSHPTWTAQQIAETLSSSASATATSLQKPFGVGLVDASAAVTASAALPTFATVGVQFEELSGDGDGNVEPGESGRLHATIKGYGPPSDASVSVQTSAPGVTISGNPVALTQVGFHRLATAAFDFALPSSLAVDQTVPFDVTITSGARAFTASSMLEPVRWAPPRVLADLVPFNTSASVTGLPNGSVAVVAELEGPSPTIPRVHGIVKSPTGQWSALTQLSGSEYAQRVNARVGTDGGLDVTFEERVGVDNFQLFYRRYTASTASWGPIEQVTTNAVLFTTAFDHVRANSAVARDSTGRIHVAYIESAGLPRTLRYTTRSESSGWSAPVTLTTFPETDLLQGRLEMFVLPDGSRRLFVQRYSPASFGFGVYREVVLSGTGTTWQAPVNSPDFFDALPPFLHGSDVYRIAKRTAMTDPLELLRWTGTTWVVDRVIGPNPSGDWNQMTAVGVAAMNSNFQFGVLVQARTEGSPFNYSSGPAGSLTTIRATQRPLLATTFPKLWLAPNDIPHAVFGQSLPSTTGWSAGGQFVYQSSVADTGMLLPAKPSISGSVTPSALTASWTVATPSQVSRYFYAVGSAPGQSDVVPWTKSSSTSINVPLTERPPASGDLFYVSVQGISTTGHIGAMGFSPGISLAQCTPETDSAFCARLAKDCGSVSGTDNCGQARTVASCGSCTAPQTCGGSGTPNVCGAPSGNAPCSNLCASPSSFTGPSFNSGNLGSGATCHQTLANLSGSNCGNFATGRTFRVNDTLVSCNGGNITLPPKVNGGYCFQASAGDHPWAYFVTW